MSRSDSAPLCGQELPLGSLQTEFAEDVAALKRLIHGSLRGSKHAIRKESIFAQDFEFPIVVNRVVS